MHLLCPCCGLSAVTTYWRCLLQEQYAKWACNWWVLLHLLQVLCRSLIKQNGYETSYICLARRAAKTNNFWNRLVRRGSITRRILMYGLLQLLFTVICITVFLPTHHLYALAFAYQVGQKAVISRGVTIRLLHSPAAADRSFEQSRCRWPLCQARQV